MPPTTAAPHHTSEGHLEEILGTISKEEAANFKDHLEYRSQDNIRRMRYDQFVTIAGGTEKLFDDVYHNAYKIAKERGLKGKAEPKAVADTLELVVIEALKGVQRPTETFLWKNFEALKATGGFRSDDERLAHLQHLALNYLGADQQEITQLLAGLRSEDPLMWNQAVREFTNKLKEGLVQHYINQHALTRVEGADKEHKFKAYTVRHLRETYGKEPEESLPRYLSPTTPIRLPLLQLDRAATAYKDAGLKEYKSPAKKG